MNIQNGKYAWMVKIGEKGQFVIPKEKQQEYVERIFRVLEG